MPEIRERTAPPRATTEKPRPPVRRSVAVLVVATLALVVFILVLGDIRRKNTPLAQAQWYASQLTDRLGSARALPLNLDVDVSPAHEPKLRRFNRLTPERARTLRQAGRRVVAAYTNPINRVLAPDGRAVVFFEAGSFSAEWLSLAEADVVLAAQQSLIQSLSDSNAGE